MSIGLTEAALLISAFRHAQPETLESLQLKVSFDAQVFALDETIPIRIEIVNVGDRPVTFFEHFELGDGGTLEYVVRRENGDKVPNWIVIDKFGDPEQPDPPRVLVPGDSVQTELFWSIDMLVEEPGSYVLEVIYVAPDLPIDDRGSEHPICKRESGPLTGSADFEVLEARD